jgi:alkylated DNA repair dioxygenase AlkB
VDAYGLAWQASLFGVSAEPAVDADFSTLTRYQLDERAWIDHAPGWLSGAAEVFEALLQKGRWQQHQRVMYGSLVEQPRLNSPWRDAEGRVLVPVLDDAVRLLSARYGVDFTSGHGGLNLYRDGHDSVAWHRDKIPPAVADPHVAIISVGEPRTFRIRPRGAGVREETPLPTAQRRAFRLGQGDLLVTGGSFQRTWEHAVPKVASAGPRISITMRHS